MEKQIIRENIGYRFDWEDSNSIESIREDLDNLEKRGATHIEIEVYEHSLHCQAYTERHETDQEQAERIRIEQERAERQKERDLKQYEIIKSKYNL